MAAYVTRPYDDRASVARMSDLMRESGAIRASSIQQRGQGWANTVNRMGDLVAGAFKDYQALKQEEAARKEADAAKAEQARVADAIKSSVDPATGRVDFEAAARAIGQIDPLRAEQFWEKADAKKAEEARKEADQTAKLADSLSVVLRAQQEDQQAGPGALQTAPRLYETMRTKAIKEGWATEDDLPEQYDEATVQTAAIGAMSGKQVFDLLFSAKNAPKAPRTGTFDGDLVNLDTGETIRKGAPKGEVVEVSDGRGGSVKKWVSNEDLKTGVPVYRKPDKPKNDGPTPAAIQRARDARFERTQALNKAIAAGDIDPSERDQRAYEIEREYAIAVGEPEPAPPRVAPSDLVSSEGSTQNRTMRDLFAEAQQPARASAPMGAGNASAAPRRVQMPKVGDVVSVRGQKVRITKVYPDGTFDAETVR